MDYPDLIQNQSHEGTPCERVLGSEARVNQMAGFYDKNYGLIQLMTLNGIKEYTENNSFSREEIDAFKAGIGAIGKFMSECSDQRNAKRELEKRTKEE